MNWLGIACGLIAVFLLGLLLIETTRFKKELKKEINKNDRSLSNSFVKGWERKTSREVILGITAFIFVILAILFK
ncbi:hypothetical protein D1B31_04755 [Neobacillus notoginsengisoli]|uniref:Uncharacterized protein n=1 Tax=Neobacillus notoginsengisoli TaxID=1578198 RepID=A0A417YWT8_9BACI|nr:hypothetical protein [Neobacillus notoginsengisoli]RHW41960.1 hypothetical protein D1B31_04755 [Neobacillus notoginsengisoli]